MVLRTTHAALIALALALPATASFAAPKTDDFVKQATAANQFEIESAKIAAEKAVSPAVKDFALKVINDHQKAGKEFEATAKTAGVAFNAPQLENKQLATIDDLIKSNAGEMEKKFIKVQLDSHKDAVKLYEEYAKDGDNAQLKALAQKMLPDLKEHLARVEQLEKNN